MQINFSDSIIPTEVLGLIFRYIPYKQHAIVKRVCKLWRDLLDDFYTFNGSFKNVHSQLYNSLVKTGNHGVYKKIARVFPRIHKINNKLTTIEATQTDIRQTFIRGMILSVPILAPTAAWMLGKAVNGLAQLQHEAVLRIMANHPQMTYEQALSVYLSQLPRYAG